MLAITNFSFFHHFSTLLKGKSTISAAFDFSTENARNFKLSRTLSYSKEYTLYRTVLSLNGLTGNFLSNDITPLKKKN